MAKCRIYETLGSVSKMKATSEGGLMTLSGVFGECGVRNRNNRVYEKSNYGKMVEEMKQRISEDGGVLGELEHPDKMTVTLENVSHKITDIAMNEDGVVTGTIQLLNTPKGKIAQAIVESGMPLFISSRAMGQIDKNGNVTLEKLSTFDIVSVGGCARARLNLNESLEEFRDVDNQAITIIAEKEENNDNMTIENLLEKFNELEERVQNLESENTELREALEERVDIEAISERIQDWVINEYSPVVERWINDEFASEYSENLTDEITESVRDEFKNMIIEKFSPAIQKWVLEEFAPVVEKWCCEEYAPSIQNWIVEEFAPEVQNYMNENFAPTLKDQILESIKDEKTNKLDVVESMIKMLEGLEVAKPKFGSKTMITESGAEEPLFIREMPDSVRPLWNQASTEVKESITRRAKIYNFNNEGAVQRFWENINFEQIKPAKSVYEGLENIEDEYERRIRAGFRRHRQILG